jgi:hypothetical protein
MHNSSGLAVACRKSFVRLKELYNASKSVVKQKLSNIIPDHDAVDAICRFLDDGVVTIKRFTRNQIDDYVRLATKNPEANKVMLGLWDDGAPTSYVTKGKDHTYFSLGNKWDDAKALVNDSREEMWKINKEFIDEQKALNKEFWLSHDPFSPGTTQFFSD